MPGAGAACLYVKPIGLVVSDIFREVESDLRREQALALWQAYGKYVIAGAAVIAGGGLLVTLWLTYQAGQRAAQSDRYIAAIESIADDPSTMSADVFADLADGASAGYRALARFQEAALLAEAGSVERAVEAYDRIAADGGVDRSLRDLARVKAAYLLADRSNPDELRARLAPLLTETNPWRLAAKDAIAFAYFTVGDDATARSEYEVLALNPLTPPNMRLRANQMLAILGPAPAGSQSAEDAGPSTANPAGPQTGAPMSDDASATGGEPAASD